MSKKQPKLDVADGFQFGKGSKDEEEEETGDNNEDNGNDGKDNGYN